MKNENLQAIIKPLDGIIDAYQNKNNTSFSENFGLLMDGLENHHSEAHQYLKNKLNNAAEYNPSAMLKLYKDFKDHLLSTQFA